MTDQGGVTVPMAIVVSLVGVVCSVAVGTVVRLAHKGALSDISESVNRIATELSLLRSDIDGKMNLLKQTIETQRNDMNAMDRRLTELDREWRRYYGGIARALPTPRLKGGHGDPDE